MIPRARRHGQISATVSFCIFLAALVTAEPEGEQLPSRVPSRPPLDAVPPAVLPEARPPVAGELIEREWRLQDGIGTEREPRGWRDAIEVVLQRGDKLVEHLARRGKVAERLAREWSACRREWDEIPRDLRSDDPRWEDLWRRVHRARRRIALSHPLAPRGPILFAKRVPSSFSHQLTQYYGRCSRPGGGLFVLESPGTSMRCRPLTSGSLPAGSVQHPEISFDGRRILFAFCLAPEPGADWRTDERFHHIWEIGADGSGLRQLTDGPFDDFSPRYLPDGRIIFLSTRRGGFHRCGRGPCPVYTLAIMEADGGEPRVISYHETHEWDPAVLHDGRVIYTRWDYVDRHAVHYQQLWTVHPDGSQPVIFFGNNTLNPVGIWEARPVPGSHLVMATAGAHHAMTAGSIILVDAARGVDGLDPITRLTPDVLFPESEFPVQHWHAPTGVTAAPPVPVEERRWPGHCYRSPFPLSEDFFLAAYSFEPLIGEPRANPPHMFGIYLVDRFGNRELLYRDPDISSLWPTPLRPRPRPPILPASKGVASPDEGTFFLQDVQRGWPELPPGEANRVRRLRVLQVLPKSTPHANQPRVGLANASPGKQVLGTVPVESDGSAYFRAPAGVPLSFQALDGLGRAVQVMRSLTYLQPGERTSCIGCHEHRSTAPSSFGRPMALGRPPSPIEPGPEGSNPFSYPRLVQPVLDRRCVSCHGSSEPAGGIVLTGEPQGEFTTSYHALAPLVPHSAWTGGDFLRSNSEPLSQPGFFGARASRLMDLLLKGHEDVRLSDDDLERLATWMDTNALFYGTFEPDDQARQRRGELIAGPAVE